MKKLEYLLSVILIVFIVIKLIHTRDARGCRGLMDIIIGIDGSDSINARDYQLLRDTMALFTDNLNIRDDEIKLSFVVYSSHIPLQTPISGNKTFLRKAAETLPHPRDGTKTDLALKTMNKIFKRDRRDGVPTLGIVFTDGISKEPEKTKKEALLLREEGVTVYAVGISTLINKQELNDIAGDVKRVKQLKSFEELRRKLNSFVTLVCPKCPTAPEIKNAFIPKGQFIVETIITYYCIKPYVSVGDPQLLCQLNQTWTPSNFKCLADCKIPENVERATITNDVYNNHLEGDLAVYTCDNNTVTEGNTTRVCQEDNKWSEVNFYCRPDCGTPPVIKYASYSSSAHQSTLEGDTITYTCDSNTVMEGNPSTTCLVTGKWSKFDLFCRPNCGEPMNIDRATLKPGGTLYGNTREYVCTSGTLMEGNPIITCHADFTWSSTDLYCRPDCGIPMDIPRAKLLPGSKIEGVLTGGGTLEGDKRKYECDSNTVMEGDPYIVCTVDGTWSPTNLYCQPDCGPPPSFLYAKASPTGTLEGDIITYVCDDNTVKEGSYQTTCQQNGTWSDINLFCRPDCGIPMNVDRALLKPGLTLAGSQREYVCQSGTVMEGDPTIMCKDDFKWTPTKVYCRPDCGPPAAVPYSKYSSTGTTLEGDVITYVCDNNTVMEGNPATTCLVTGQWSPTDVYCRPNCGIPMNIDRATLKPGPTTYGTTREYVCIAGTVMEGSPFITCNEDFNWSNINLYCRPDCGPPREIQHATFTSTRSTLEGDVVTYTCAHNTVMEGNHKTTCLITGQWSPYDVYCRPDCGIPMDIARAVVKPGPTTYGTTREYQCAVGTVMEGQPFTTCQDDFQWSSTDLYCRPDCGPPRDIQYATYASTGTTLEGDTVTYTCAQNTVAEGNPKSTCLVTGAWSLFDLYCRPNCGVPMDIERATIKPGLTTFESTREYICAAGTVMEGNPTITCMADFKWSSTDLYCRPDCGSPPSIQYAKFTSSGTTVENDVITYTCADNTVMEGNPSTTCLTSGSWSSFSLYCRPNCGIPMDIARAKVKPGLTTYQSTREYVCGPGTVMEGNPTITCMEDFRWSSTDLYCRPDCGTPPSIQYASFVSSGSTLEGDVITYTCADNTVMEGNPTTTCLTSGSWSSFDLYCRPNCGIPMDIARATIKPGLTTYQSTREYVCAADTVMEGNPTVTCMEDFRWSSTDLYCRPDCGTPPSIQYASFVSSGSTLEGDVITYTCADNTVLEGNPKTTCLTSGSWSSFDMYCRPNCGIPMDIARAMVKPGLTTYQTTREYVCGPDTVMEGNPTITCMEDFRWSSTDLYCRPDCGAPPTIQYATFVSSGTTLEADVVTYTCAENTVMEGEHTTTCLASGSWSSFDLYCRPNCDTPMDVDRATIKPGLTTYQSKREYVCAAGTVMEGNPFITCNDDFKWTSIDLYCRPNCGEPKMIQYSTYTSTRSTLEGDIVTYTCAENTVMEGNPTTTCLISGQWSDTDVYCRPDCGIPMDIERATIQPGKTTYETTREYVCATGTVMEGNPTITCMNDFTWSKTDLYCRPDCGTPPIVKYASYSSSDELSTLEGDAISYTCDSNTVMEGNPTTTCLVTGEWSKFDLFCRPNCGEPMGIDRATLQPGDTTYGNTRDYVCATGTVMEGNPQIICNADFTWSSTDLYCRPDCGPPQNIRYATYVSTRSTLQDDVVTYTCAENTVMEGNPTTTCLISGQWSDMDVYCRPNCGIPMNIDRATIKPGLTTYETTREYVCASGTVMEGNPAITCMEDFNWSKTNLYCRPDCGTPPIIKYAAYSSSEQSTLEGDVITYTCDSNTVMEGNPSTTCLVTGEWSQFDLYCRPNCGVPVNIDRATLTPGKTTYGSTLEYVCAPGTVMEGNPKITCNADFNWSSTDLYCRPDCGEPRTVLYATYDVMRRTLQDDTITYTCAENTVLEGNPTITCLVTGQWSETDIYCRPNCGIPMDVVRAKIKDGPTTYGTIREYVCDSGTVMEGDPFIKCNEDFTWSSTNLYCRPNCGKPPSIQYASYGPSRTLEGDVVTYSCGDNTVIEGNTQTTCLVNGSWSYIDIYCRPNCGMPMDIPRATIKPGLTTYGTTREYVCDVGTVMEGNPQITCRDDFTWSSTDLYCRPNCGIPMTIQHATYDSSSRTLQGDSITYACAKNTVMEGHPTTVCLISGLWSDIDLYCRPNCGIPMDIVRATVKDGPTTYGTTREYVCDTGTVMEGDPFIKCNEDFTWSTTNIYCRPNCGQPPTIQYASYGPSRTLEGDVVDYYCSDNTVLEGNHQTTCLVNGSWSPIDMFCRPDCGIPMDKPRAKLKPGLTTFESTREYICDEGTVMEGNPQIMCRDDFSWSPTDIYCRPDCGTPRIIEYASYDTSSRTLEGDVITYTCAENTVMEGNPMTTCLISGQWSDFDVYCRPNCGIPMNIDRARIKPGPTTYESTLEYECVSGTVMEGNPEITCLEDFNWSKTNLYCRPDCGKPPEIQYASYNTASRTLEGDMISYSCGDNTVIEGNYQTTCLVNGTWSYIDIYCRPNCGMPMDIPRATIKPGLTTYGTTREYVCDVGTVMEGNPLITCRDDFTWSSTDLYCRPNCGIPMTIQHAMYDSSSRTLQGDSITYACAKNTVMEGNPTTVCLISGLWSDIDLYCRPNCGIPMDIVRATVKDGPTTYGTTREYVCDSGTVMEGDPFIKCNEDFTWSTTNIYCRPNCGQPPTIQYASYGPSRTLEGDVVDYYCSDNTVLEGNHQTTCLVNGSWSPIDMFCRPDCGIPMDKPRAKLKPGLTTFESTREYICDEGTVMEGNPKIVCRDDFSWSPTDIYCRPDCGAPRIIEYASYDTSSRTLEGDVITYTCTENTVMEGNPMTTCLISGQWSDIDVYCRPNCGIPMNIDRARIKPGPTTYESTLEYECVSGTVMEGNPEITCLEDFNWSKTNLYCRPDCGKPPEIQYASYNTASRTLEGDMISYSCGDNTVIEGNYQTTCLVNGTWSYIDIYCRPNCGMPMDIPRATIKPGLTTYGTTREYLCDVGTVMEGNPLITCKDDFTWSSTDLYCRPNCGAPMAIQYATYDSSSRTLQGDSITYACAQNTVMEGNPTTMCLISGLWSDIDLYCRPDCGIPMDIVRATIKDGPTVYGTTREYVCDSGTVMEGDPFIKCKEDFTWSTTNLYCRPDCGQPPTIQYASYGPSRTLEGDVVDYYCSDNTVLEGNHQTTCLVNGSWSPIDMFCRPDCGIPMDKPRAKLKPGLTTYETTREYICDEGTVMEGNPLITCRDDFSWSPTDLYCRPDCGAPRIIEHASYDTSSRTLQGDVITYTCAENTVMEGHPMTTCLISGQWSDIDVYCRPNCGIPMNIERAMMKPGPTTYESTLEYECVSGTVMEGNPKITCMEDFQWSTTNLYCRPDCGKPPDIQYASYDPSSRTLEGDVITYSCGDNTVIEGNYQTTCLKTGMWSQIDIYCRPNCGMPMSIERATIKPGLTTYGTTREYVCAEGTVMEGNPLITCRDDFTWSSTDLYCRPDCGQPPIVRYSTSISTRSTLEGDTITFTCSENTVMEGNPQITCLPSGKWSDVSVYCRPNCGPPPTVLHSTYVSTSSTLEGDVITYTCSDNTVMEGNPTTTCSDKGQWSSFDLYCRPDCGIPMNVDRAQLKPGLTTYGSTREYVCADGTVMEGNPFVKCLDDFKWSSTDLYCRPNCGKPPTIRYSSYGPSRTLEGDTVTYSCAENTVLEGNYITTCQVDGTWSHIDLYCRPNCGIPMDRDRAILKPGPTTYESTREYTCVEGTVLEGNPVITCMEDFRWSFADFYCRPNCGLPPKVQYSSYTSSNSTLEGDVVTYTCTGNTVMEGNPTTTCLVSGQWSSFDLYCRPDCGIPMNVDRAQLKPGPTTYGSVREYICADGTVMEGDPFVKCLEDFTWSSSDLYCRPNCGKPPVIRYSSYGPSRTLEGDTVTYSCAENTILEGNYITTCQVDGTWSHIDLYCRPDCGIPMDIPRAKLQSGLTTYESTLTYICNEGTVAEGNPQITCQKNFLWTSTDLYCRPDCGKPPEIRYASYDPSSRTLEGDVITYSCGDNTVIEGNYKTTCLGSGMWSDIDIYCRPNCGMPPNIERAIIKPGLTTYGTIREYMCVDRTIMEGTPKITCQDDFTWSATDLFCRPDCGPPKTVLHATISEGATTYGSTLVFNCNENTVMEGDPKVTCGEDSMWSMIKVYCRPDCGIPMNIDRATLQPGPTLSGSVRQYICDSGTYMEGNPNIACQDDFTWTTTDLYCRPDCGQPPKIQYASYYNARTLEGDTVQYTCSEHTVSEGISQTTCQQNGTWSYIDLYCRPDCGPPPKVQYASYTEGRTLEGDVITYFCDDQTITEGLTETICLKNGSWSHFDIYCRPNCGMPPQIPRATIKPGPTTYGTVRQYVCDDGTVTEGNIVTVCQKDFTWSTTDLYCRPSCGLPPIVPRATYSSAASYDTYGSARTLEGDTIRYNCKQNTVAEGISTTTCQANGTWSFFDLYCRPDCGIPMEIPRATIKPGLTTYGSSREYVCDYNTFMEGNPMILCQDDFTWTHTDLYCRPNCGPPPHVNHSVYNPGPTLEDNVITYICDDNTIPEGNNQIKCLSSGVWSHTDLRCKLDCGEPPHVDNSTLRPGSNAEGDSRFYVCDDTYITEGDTEIKCLSNGTWSKQNVYCRSECGKPMLPRYARLEYPGSTTEGSMLKLGCDPGSVPVGDPNITCKKDGTWTPPMLKCKPDCGLPIAIPRAKVEIAPEVTIEGTVVQYVCDENTVSIGNTTSTCLDDGTWSPVQLYCQADCGQPPLLPRATLSGYDTSIGSVVHYVCDDGTVPEGTESVTCQDDGTWSHLNLYCRPDCGMPTYIQDAMISPMSTLEGSFATYSCTGRSIGSGNATIICESDGFWSHTDFYCRADCGPPPRIANSLISDGHTTESAIRTYSCIARHVGSGNKVIRCQTSGEWTATDFKCKADCGQPRSLRRATIEEGETTQGSIRKYVCDADTEGKGDPHIECLPSGVWSVTTLTCTPVSKVKPPPKNLNPLKGPCDDCKMANGVGFNPHPEDCDKFVQCYFGPNHEIISAYRSCPFGQYWDQKVLTCRPAKHVACPHEKCQLPGLVSYPMSTTDNCRAYWRCNLGKSFGLCCDKGYLYKPYYGCVKDRLKKCNESCPPLIYGEGECMSRADFRDPSKFEMFVPGFGWQPMPCAPGTHYDHAACGCAFHASYSPRKPVCKPELYIPFDNDAKDKSGKGVWVNNTGVQVVDGVGYFNGYAYLSIPRFTNFEYGDLVVSVKFLETPPTRKFVALVSNSDCCHSSPTMALVKSERNMHYLAKCGGGKSTTFHLPIHVGNWNQIHYMHNGEKLEGSCNGIKTEKWAIGKIKPTHTAIHIGYGRGFSKFKGYIDEVTIFLCRPSYL